VYLNPYLGSSQFEEEITNTFVEHFHQVMSPAQHLQAWQRAEPHRAGDPLGEGKLGSVRLGKLGLN